MANPFKWLGGLFRRKAGTAAPADASQGLSAAPGSDLGGPPDPTIASLLGDALQAREDDLRAQARDSHSDSLKDKLHSQADEVAGLRAMVLDALKESEE